MLSADWKFRHAGLIVRDIHKACDQYRSLGFEIMLGPYETPPKYPDNAMSSMVAFVKRDVLVLEIMQPLSGRWVIRDFLESNGEGMNHLCFEVADIAAEREKMIGMGFPVVYGFTVAMGTFAYFDTRKVGNIIIELLEPPAAAQSVAS